MKFLSSHKSASSMTSNLQTKPNLELDDLPSSGDERSDWLSCGQRACFRSPCVGKAKEEFSPPGFLFLTISLPSQWSVAKDSQSWICNRQDEISRFFAHFVVSKKLSFLFSPFAF